MRILARPVVRISAASHRAMLLRLTLELMHAARQPLARHPTQSLTRTLTPSPFNEAAGWSSEPLLATHVR
eukprot:13835050-Alexandrium_andersonii.AAC.1